MNLSEIISPNSLAAKWLAKKELYRTGHDLFAGQQDEIDIISYASLVETVDHIEIDGIFTRCLYISAYPYIANSGWLDSLVNFNHSADISYHLTVVDAADALPHLARKITELESTRRSMMREGRIVGTEVTDPLESATELRSKILRGQEKLYQVAIYVSLTSDSLVKLNKVTKLLETTMASKLFYVKTARYQQLDALDSILPRAQDKLRQRRNLDSSTTALTFPFVSSELTHTSGILYGINKSNNSLAIIDRYCLNNANSIVFAQSGSGKSYATKVEVLRQLMQGTKVIVIDPEREYKKLTESVGGAYIKISARSKQKINPFENVTALHGKSNLADHAQHLTGFVSLLADGLDSRERAVLDRAIMELYAEPQNKAPVLKDLYIMLKGFGQDRLCERMEKYITGSLRYVFNAKTNVELNNRLVTFDIKDLPETLRQIMMMVISHFVESRVKDSPEKRLLVIDEGWLLLQHEETARFMAGLVRRARKYYLGVSIISQQANDFLQDTYGAAIASQSSLRILMRQDTTTIDNVRSAFNLSEYESNFLMTCDRGEALVLADRDHVAVKVVADAREHPLITTNPAELYQ